MSSAPDTSSDARPIRVLLCVLAVLAVVAALIATRLVSAGSIHHGQDTMQAVATYHRTAHPTSLDVALDDFGPILSSLPGDYEMAGSAAASVLGTDAMHYDLRRMPGGERVTLLRWLKSGASASLKSSSRDVDDVRVDLWSDATHVFALARDL